MLSIILSATEAPLTIKDLSIVYGILIMFVPVIMGIGAALIKNAYDKGRQSKVNEYLIDESKEHKAVDATITEKLTELSKVQSAQGTNITAIMKKLDI